MPDSFSQVLFSFTEAAGRLFPEVKNVKVEGLGTLIFPGRQAPERGRERLSPTSLPRGALLYWGTARPHRSLYTKSLRTKDVP